MIQIVVNGIVLPIPPGQQLVREVETTIFNRETSVSDFSYPIDIPLTDDVKRAFRMPHVIAGANYQKEHEADHIVNGVYLSRVIIRILRVSPLNKTISISIIGDYGSFAKEVGDKMLNELDLGGIRTYSTTPQYEFTNWQGWEYINIFFNYTDFNAYMYDLAVGTAVDDFVFYAAADDNPNIPTLHGTGKSIINYWDPTNSYFPDPVKMNFEAALLDKPDRYFWVPFFRVSFVLKKCFEENGFTVIAGIFNDANFRKVTLWNTCSINECRMTQEVNNFILDVHIFHDQNRIDPRNHVPKMTISEFITEIGKIFNLQYIFDWTHRTVTIRQISVPTLSSSNIIDLSSYAAPEPDINYEEENFSRGYEFSFSSPQGNIRDDLSKYPVISSVDYRGLNPATGQDGDLMFMKSQNAYYQKNGGQWTFFSHNLGSFKTSEESDLQTISCKFSPVYMEPYTPSIVDGAKKILFPTSAVGIEGKNILCIVKPDFTSIGQGGEKYMDVFSITSVALEESPKLLCNWHGMQVNEIPRLTMAPWLGTIAPYGSSTVYDARGYTGAPGAFGTLTPYTHLQGINLAWNSPLQEGLYRYCKWDEFVAGLIDAPQAEYQVLLTPDVYQRLNLNEALIHINGLLFLCKKATITMPFPEVSELTLVRL